MTQKQHELHDRTSFISTGFFPVRFDFSVSYKGGAVHCAVDCGPAPRNESNDVGNDVGVAWSIGPNASVETFNREYNDFRKFVYTLKRFVIQAETAFRRKRADSFDTDSASPPMEFHPTNNLD